MRFLIIKLWGDILVNLRFIFNPGSCGYFCLRYILKKQIKKESYMSLWRVKEILSNDNYYCSCLRLETIYDLKRECLTLINTGGNSKHYVVIKKVAKNKIWYYDPLFLFLRKKKIGRFVKKWSNICLFYTKV